MAAPSFIDSGNELFSISGLLNLKCCQQPFTNVLFCSEVGIIMPRLHLPYDEYTMSVRCPNHRFRAASAGRPSDHRTDLRASWPLRSCLTPHNDKFEKNRKPVARRHIAVNSYDPRTDTAR